VTERVKPIRRRLSEQNCWNCWRESMARLHYIRVSQRWRTRNHTNNQISQTSSWHHYSWVCLTLCVWMEYAFTRSSLEFSNTSTTTLRRTERRTTVSARKG